MAATFTVLDSFVENYPPNSPRKVLIGRLVATGGDGASAGDIPASVFGLTKIEETSRLVKSDNTVIADAEPSYDGTSLLTRLDASVGTPVDLTAGTYALTVKGY